MKLQLKELTTKQEMLAQYPVMQYLYTNFSLEKYNTYLDDMIPNNYKQIAVLKVMYVLDSPDCGLEQNSGLASI
jgi:hypothetical protein